MIKRILKILAALAMIIVLLNLPVTTKQAVDYKVKTIQIPLYIKIIELVDRDFWYRHIAGELTSGLNNDKDKAIAIFDWVRENIHAQPAEFDVIDDHIRHIIIRRYGSPDQMTDVFTTLCVYSGMTAFWDIGYDAKHKILYSLSFVKAGDRWYVFDCYLGKYFKTNFEKIQTPEHALKDKEPVENDQAAYKGVPYEEIYSNLEFKKEVSIFRAEEQMPLKRLILESRRALNLKELDKLKAD